MKKLRIFLSLLFSCASLSALYQSNPSTPEIIDEGFFLDKDLFMAIRIGYQHDQIFDRRLKVSQMPGKMHEVTQYYDQGVLTLNFMDRVEFFGSVGAMNINVNERQPDAITITSLPSLTPPYQVIYQTHNNLTWGAGVRADIIDWCNTTFGASASYQWAHPHMRWNTINGTLVPNYARIRWAEWQVGIALGYKVDIFRPYVGVNYSKVFARVRRTIRSLDGDTFPHGVKMRSQEHFGLALGCDLSSGRIFDLGVEMRLISEQSLTLKGDIKF